MDFTLRLSESQEVIAIGSTYVNHHYAPSKRDDEVLIAGATGTLYAYLLNVFPSRFSKKRMIVGTSLKYFWATRFIHPVRFVKLLTEFLQHLKRELKHKSLEG
jgi:hypothetical protein